MTRKYFYTEWEASTEAQETYEKETIHLELSNNVFYRRICWIIFVVSVRELWYFI